MRSKFKDLISRLNVLGIADHLRDLRKISRDSFAFGHLPHLSIGFVPWSSYALTPRAVLAILNEVAINRASRVIECGIGISTLHLLNPNFGHDVQLVGIDDNLEWIETIRGYLDEMSVDKEKYRLVHAPLVECEHKYSESSANIWYGRNRIDDAVTNLFGPSADVDLLLVDGPKGAVGPHARFPALPCIAKHLASDFSVMLDDALRPDEREISRRWADQFDLSIKSNSAEDDLCVLRPHHTEKLMTIGS